MFPSDWTFMLAATLAATMLRRPRPGRARESEANRLICFLNVFLGRAWGVESVPSALDQPALADLRGCPDIALSIDLPSRCTGPTENICP